MKDNFLNSIYQKCTTKQSITQSEALKILAEVPLLDLVQTAYKVRYEKWKNTVTIHIINNIQNGFCPEDCSYCAQAKTAKTGINDYPIKSDEEILNEAKAAYERGAFRYCMVSAGRGPSKRRVSKLAELISKIKEKYPIQVCLSPGLLNDESATTLKEAGLDRLNHNLNTSKNRYQEICSTHTYQDRLNTLQSAKKAGLELCSGMIVGMGESNEEIIELATKFKELEVPSIPINFFIPIEGTPLSQKTPTNLSPEFCVRILCLMRFFNPNAEIRIAAGRELHLRSLQGLALHAANSIFMDGYLNATGTNQVETLQIIKDNGFTIESEFDLELLLKTSELNVKLKSLSELNPAKKVTVKT
ncbi:biotin synthase BioB [Candidatus Marinamargulisbacteria bacterium SCGC AG-410-N11]|nr:biotin synthase BioB [Candidatus Marinamargulisbacteria bacterium SCGC AG-410-N11]